MRNVALALVVCVVVWGQAEPGNKPPELVSDRPDFTESAESIRRGDIQWESGFSWERAAGSRTGLMGTPLMRLGLGRKLELRLASDGWTSLSEGPGGPDGPGRKWRGLPDSSVGFKWKFLESRDGCQRWR